MTNKAENIILGIFIAIIILIFLSVIGIEIYIWITYANTPINELPSWVVFFMIGGRK